MLNICRNLCKPSKKNIKKKDKKDKHGENDKQQK